MRDTIIRPFTLIKRVIFAAMLTAAALVFASMKGLFWGTKPIIKIRFDLEYDNYAGNQFRFHYKAHGAGAPRKTLPPIKLDRRQIKVKIDVPSDSLSHIWLGFGKSPGAVTCRNFRIRGSKKFTFNDLRVLHYPHVKNLKLHPEGFSCRSTGNNPWLVLQPRQPLLGPKGLTDPWALGIVLVSVFIIALAVSRPIFNRGTG